MCEGVEFLIIKALLHTKSEQKGIGNYICTPMIFKNSFFNKKYTFTICVGLVWVVIVYFLLEKQTFNGLLKVISILMYIAYNLL